MLGLSSTSIVEVVLVMSRFTTVSTPPLRLRVLNLSNTLCVASVLLLLLRGRDSRGEKKLHGC